MVYIFNVIYLILLGCSSSNKISLLNKVSSMDEKEITNRADADFCIKSKEENVAKEDGDDLPKGYTKLNRKTEDEWSDSDDESDNKSIEEENKSKSNDDISQQKGEKRRSLLEDIPTVEGLKREMSNKYPEDDEDEKKEKELPEGYTKLNRKTEGEWSDSDDESDNKSIEEEKGSKSSNNNISQQKGEKRRSLLEDIPTVEGLKREISNKYPEDDKDEKKEKELPEGYTKLNRKTEGEWSDSDDTDGEDIEKEEPDKDSKKGSD